MLKRFLAWWSDAPYYRMANHHVHRVRGFCECGMNMDDVVTHRGSEIEWLRDRLILAESIVEAAKPFIYELATENAIIQSRLKDHLRKVLAAWEK